MNGVKRVPSQNFGEASPVRSEEGEERDLPCPQELSAAGPERPGLKSDKTSRLTADRGPVPSDEPTPPPPYTGCRGPSDDETVDDSVG